jgi:leucine-zipper-like transcriptional regulator 1
LWKFDIETKKWTCIQDSSGPAPGNDPRAEELLTGPHGTVPTRRFGYVSVVHNGKFILFGAYNNIRLAASAVYSSF